MWVMGDVDEVEYWREGMSMGEILMRWDGDGGILVEWNGGGGQC
jgi:hypothetical protein